MDITVRRLNNRLALQIPTELPLGLVFVVGEVQNLRPAEDSETNGRSARVQFQLVEDGYRLRCQLQLRQTETIPFREGDQVRLGGHLAFDTQEADYFLMARDVERIGEESVAAPLAGEVASISDQESLREALSAIKKRSEVAQLAPAELPVWVRKMAPPGVETEAPEAAPESETTPDAAALDNEELVAFLSQAMESDEEVELTPEVLAEYVPQTAVPEPTPPPASAAAQPTQNEAAKMTEEDVYSLQSSYRPTNPRDTDWLVILLIISFFIMTIAAIAATILIL